MFTSSCGAISVMIMVIAAVVLFEQFVAGPELRDALDGWRRDESA